MAQPSPFEIAGGEEAFLALARAFHQRCLDDPVLSHPFSHPGHPQHVERLAGYWAEALGGPPLYTSVSGGHSEMVHIHAGMNETDDLVVRFVDCFLLAIDDAGLPEDPELRRCLRAYMEWATADIHRYAPTGSVVPADLPLPRWSWDGLVRDTGVDERRR